MRNHAAAGARLDVDAAILFSDILVPLPGMGVDVAFNPGPQLARTIRAERDVTALRVPDPHETTPFVLDAVRLIRASSADACRSSGLPARRSRWRRTWSRAAGSKSFSAIKRCSSAHQRTARPPARASAPTRWRAISSAQVEAGAQAAMLFDTWAGLLAPADVRTFALPLCAARRRGGAASRGPRASAGTCRSSTTPGDAAGWIDGVPEIGADVIGLDWRMGLDAARAASGLRWRCRAISIRRFCSARARSSERLGCSAPRSARRRGRTMRRGPAAGHIFNLGSWHPAADAARSCAAAGRHRAGTDGGSLMPRRPPAAAARPLRATRSLRRRSTCPLDLLRRYDRPGPRYTSYPTAVEFHDGFDEAAYRDRLAEAAAHAGRPAVALPAPAVLPGALLVLRLHGHHHARSTRSRRATSTTCSREIAMLADALGRPPARRAVPLGRRHADVLSRCAQMAALHGDGRAALRRRSPGAEVAIEVDPRVTTHEQLALLRDLGFNRLSFGVQDFDARGAGGHQSRPARGRRRAPCSTTPAGSASSRSTST